METVTGKLRMNTLVDGDGDGIGHGVGMCKQTLTAGRLKDFLVHFPIYLVLLHQNK